jgi:hypothetical protein
MREKFQLRPRTAASSPPRREAAIIGAAAASKQRPLQSTAARGRARHTFARKIQQKNQLETNQSNHRRTGSTRRE